MKGLLRPQEEVQASDICPTLGTVNTARKGATPRMIDMLVSVKPAFRSRGGMKVKATQAAISSPATTAFMASRRGTDRLFTDDTFIIFGVGQLAYHFD